ncbi:MAG TPA: hypothetical protein VG754_04450, partial [Verrucomicrobiae bacterium]|nr:hypothetical protein [Verrucomicrobiae bacterium]
MERKAGELPASAWTQHGEEYHAFFRHQPGRPECAPVICNGAAAGRDGLFDQLGFTACDEGQTNAGRVFDRQCLLLNHIQ